MPKHTRHKARTNPRFLQSFIQESSLRHDQIRFVKSSVDQLNEKTEQMLDVIAETVRNKLEAIVAEGDFSKTKHIKIEVYMPVMCTPYCIENENEEEQILHINAPIQFSPVKISQIVDDEPVE